jgi:hypothetical protein
MNAVKAEERDMPSMLEATRLRIFIGEGQRYGHQPLP